MPILKSDMPAINEGADKLSALLLGTIQRRQEAERQKQLDVQKAQELMPLETEEAVNRARSMLPVQKEQLQQEADSAFESIKRLTDSGIVPEGAGASVKGASIQRPVNLFRQEMDRNKAISGQTLTLSEKVGKPLSEMGDSLENIHTTLDLLTNPNKYDEKNIGAAGAREAEGKGQRLLQSVIQNFQANGQSIPGWLLKASNNVSGGAKTAMSPDEIRGLTDHFLKLADARSREYGVAKERFNQLAPQIGTMLSPDQIQNVVGASVKRGDTALSHIEEFKKNYQKTHSTEGMNMPPEQMATKGNYEAVKDRLFDLLKGPTRQQSSAPAASQQPVMTFEQFKEWKRSKGGQ